MKKKYQVKGKINPRGNGDKSENRRQHDQICKQRKT